MLQPSELLKVALVLAARAPARPQDREGRRPRAGAAARGRRSRALAAGVVLLAAGPRHGGLLRDALRRAALARRARGRGGSSSARSAMLPLLAVLLLSGRLPPGAASCRSCIPRPIRSARGFQAIQSLIAVGAGGWFGNGLGGSRQKLFFLPYPAHRLHLRDRGRGARVRRRASASSRAFGVVAWRGLRAARRAPDAFAAFLAAGATAMIVVQAAINLSRRARARADQGHPAPVRLVRRLVARRLVDRRGPHPERLAARGAEREPDERMSRQLTVGLRYDPSMSELGDLRHRRRRDRRTHPSGDRARRRDPRADARAPPSSSSAPRTASRRRLVPAAGFPLELVDASGFVGKTLAQQLQSLVAAAARLLGGARAPEAPARRARSSGVGGYVTCPS